MWHRIDGGGGDARPKAGRRLHAKRRAGAGRCRRTFRGWSDVAGQGILDGTQLIGCQLEVRPRGRRRGVRHAGRGFRELRRVGAPVTDRRRGKALGDGGNENGAEVGRRPRGRVPAGAIRFRGLDDGKAREGRREDVPAHVRRT